MNWLTNFVKPKLGALVGKRQVQENLWHSCPSCANMMHHKDLYDNLRVCITCDYHFRMNIEDRINILFEEKNFKEIELDSISDDPLNFNDQKKYKWSDSTKLEKMKDGDLPAYIINNRNKYSDWLD